MALKLSTGLRNFLLGEGNIRKAFENGDLPGANGGQFKNLTEGHRGISFGGSIVRKGDSFCQFVCMIGG